VLQLAFEIGHCQILVLVLLVVVDQLLSALAIFGEWCGGGRFEIGSSDLLLVVLDCPTNFPAQFSYFP
jgi:hypothetical protein